MDYSKLSDFEINRAVAIAIGFNPDDCDIAKRGSPSVGVEWNEDTGYAIRAFDYCNNPADAWPIIEANNIAVIPYRHTLPQAWPTAFGVTSRFTTEDEKPLRAAMIVILKLQESANVPVNSTGSDLR
ncbi:hypothetical protein YA49_21650 [Enterobacter cloacae subsp. cloacae]|uniref:phage protein NinX family protein n=1 Tax=Enterobacter cloacae TaxID=550 RepID=UPI00063AD506|nr:phage protein NinX family protein [Enterobacter cloacae]KLG03024.1 hypothetical protein YA49_21650 [Enterobacter cloacae subsp. cloacae]